MLKYIFYSFFITLAAATVPPYAASLHESYMADYIDSKTFKLDGDQGSGTGFAVEAPSGKVYILTNRHVCEITNMWIISPRTSNKRPVRAVKLELSEETDLCIIEAPSYVTEGLKVAENEPTNGQGLAVTGHPHGSLQPVLSRGKFLAKERIWHPWEIVDSPDQCAGEGRLFVNVWFYSFCLKEIDSYLTTVPIYPGNSGSALVNFWGRVQGVVWGADARSNFGVAVPLEDVKRFLSVY